MTKNFKIFLDRLEVLEEHFVTVKRLLRDYPEIHVAKYLREDKDFYYMKIMGVDGNFWQIIFLRTGKKTMRWEPYHIPVTHWNELKRTYLLV